MIGTIIRQQLQQLVRTKQFWLFGLFFAGFVFSFISFRPTMGGLVVNVNAASILVAYISNYVNWAVFLVAIMVAPSVSRDFELNTWQVVFSKPVPWRSYVIGKFTGSVLAVFLCYAFVVFATMAAIHGPFVDPETIGPFRLGDYLFAYGVIALPNLLLMSAALFCLSTLTRKNLYAYVGAVLIFILSTFGRMWTNRAGLESLMGILDPFARGIIPMLTRYWTPYELNTQSLPLAGPLLTNRLIWIGVSLGLIALTAFRFNAYPRSETIRAKSEVDAKKSPVTTRPNVTPMHDTASAWRKLFSRTAFEVRSTLFSVPFLAMLGLGLIYAFVSATLLKNFMGTTPPLPVTHVLASSITESYSIILMIVITYYAGELIWRERQLKVYEIIDAMPTRTSTFFISKLLSLWLVVGVTLLVSVAAMIAFQFIRGTPIDLAIYARELSFIALPFLWISVLALLFQTLSPNKYIGMGIMVAYIALRVLRDTIFNASTLWVFGTHPSIMSSGISNATTQRIEAIKYDLYWAMLTIGLTVIIYVLWQRGTHEGLIARVKRAWKSKTVPQIAVLAVSVLAFGLIGRSLYVEDYVNNPTPPGKDYANAVGLQYEQTLRPLEDKPRITAKSLFIEIDTYLETQHIWSRGQLVLENRTDLPIDETYVGLPYSTVEHSLSVSGARLLEEFPLIRHFRYGFDRAMLPGETRTVDFDFKIDLSEYPNGALYQLVENGTMMRWPGLAPWFGFFAQPVFLVHDPQLRKKYGLPEEITKKATHEEEWGRYEVMAPAGDFMDFEGIYGVDKGQTGLMSGKLIKTWEEGDRTYFHYKSEAPIWGDVFLLQGAWDVVRDSAAGTDLAIYYPPGNDYHVDKFMKYLNWSVQYLDKNVGAYPYKQFNIAAVAGDHSFEPATGITSLGEKAYISDWESETSINWCAFYLAISATTNVWGVVVPPASMEGDVSLLVGLPYYTAGSVLEEYEGREMAGQLRSYLIRNYHTSRNVSKYDEPPVARAVIQGGDYIAHFKTPITLFTIRELIGEEAMTRALRGFYEEWKFARGPYPTFPDLIDQLRANSPPEYQATITDLFERIVLHDLSILDASVEPTADGKFKVRATIHTRKFERTPEGKEEPANLHEPVQIVVVDQSIRTKGRYTATQLANVRQWIDEEETVLEFVVDRQPAAIIVDPMHNFIERNMFDNVKFLGVSAQSSR